MRLVGTTKSTIQAIRDRSHWNSANLTPLDPVTLGLCSQIDLDLEVQRAAKEKPAPVEAQGATLLPASVTTAPKEEPPAPAAAPTKKSDDLDVEAVFAKLKQLGGGKGALPIFDGGNMGVRRRQLHTMLKRSDYAPLLASGAA